MNMYMYAYFTEHVRLNGGSGPYEGRVEVYNHDHGQWGTVCDDGFDNTDGDVVCKQLGYIGALEIYGAVPGSGPIWLDNVDCTGTEESLLNCSHNGIGNHNCRHCEDVGVKCQGMI